MTLSSLLNPNLIKISLSSENKFQAIEELIECLDEEGKINNKDLALENVIEREQYLSTGLENGLAVPHGKSRSVKQLVMALGVSKEGIDFDSLDGKPTTIIFLLVSPKDTSGPHIKALAQITRGLKDSAVREKIKNASSPEEIYSLFVELDKNK